MADKPERLRPEKKKKVRKEQEIPKGATGGTKKKEHVRTISNLTDLFIELNSVLDFSKAANKSEELKMAHAIHRGISNLQTWLIFCPK